MGQLGDTLRERRMALGITLDQAEEDTKIRAKLLDALESGEYAKLPNPGYVRGYVSSYARYLELDPVPMLAMYRAETGSGRFHDINLTTDEAVAPRGEQHAVPWTTAAVVVLVIAVLSLGGWFIWRSTQKPAGLPPVPATTTSTVNGGGPGPGAPATSPTTPFTGKVTVSKTGASSVKITVDGLAFYSGTLTAGQSKEFQATTSAVIVIGKPSAVTVTQDGQKVAVPANAPATVTLKSAAQ